MPLETFDPDPLPSPGTTRKPKLKLLEVEFGDGYSQVTRDGMNHIRRTIDLRWELLLPAKEREFDAFFTRHGGDTPFWYTPSDETTPVRWTCKDWETRTSDDGFREFTAKFEQSFNLDV